MLSIGRKLYYDNQGSILCDTGEKEGDVRETNQEEDLIDITDPTIKGSVFDYIQFNYSETPADYLLNSSSYKVDINTKTLIKIP